MRLGRAPASRFVMVAAMAAASVVLVMAGPRLRAQNPPRGELFLKDSPKADPAPTPPNDLPEPILSPVEPGPSLPPIEAVPTPSSKPTRAPTAPSRVLPSPSSTAPGPMVDPEAAAFRFVERTTTEADDAIKALSKEAETLRERLKKVEAGLTRWKSVKVSLATNAERATWKAKATGDDALPEPAVGRLDSGKPEVSPSKPDGAKSPFDLDPPPDRQPAPDEAKPKPGPPDAVSPPPVVPVPAETIRKK